MSEEAEEAAETSADQAPEEAETAEVPETAEAPETEESAEKAPEEKDAEEADAGKKMPKKDPKDQKIEELEDRLKRNLAEFDNFRKRTEKEKSAMFDMGAKSILEKLLPVIDNFERAFSTIPEDPEAAQYAKGMEMIYRQLLKNLEDAGARPIECKGKPFDPNYHNAVMHVEDESLGENMVAEEFQKGYMYKDSVLRYSMVKVAN
ncbi:MAG: nucleotide exchange factor GrpE [Stomatobaculum sp.]|nr:nucleotide exchange factor GrpE [Stomatobaculum sp.]